MTKTETTPETTETVKKLWKNHRAIGYEIARTTANGTEYIILDVGTYKPDVAAIHTLMEASRKECMVKTITDMSTVVESAHFLGLSDDDIRKALEKALAARAKEKAELEKPA